MSLPSANAPPDPAQNDAHDNDDVRHTERELAILGKTPLPSSERKNENPAQPSQVQSRSITLPHPFRLKRHNTFNAPTTSLPCSLQALGANSAFAPDEYDSVPTKYPYSQSYSRDGAEPIYRNTQQRWSASEPNSSYSQPPLYYNRDSTQHSTSSAYPTRDLFQQTAPLPSHDYVYQQTQPFHRRDSIHQPPPGQPFPRRDSIHQPPASQPFARRDSIHRAPPSQPLPSHDSINQPPTPQSFPRRDSIHQTPSSQPTTRRDSIRQAPPPPQQTYHGHSPFHSPNAQPYYNTNMQHLPQVDPYQRPHGPPTPQYYEPAAPPTSYYPPRQPYTNAPPPRTAAPQSSVPYTSPHGYMNPASDRWKRTSYEAPNSAHMLSPAEMECVTDSRTQPNAAQREQLLAENFANMNIANSVPAQYSAANPLSPEEVNALKEFKRRASAPLNAYQLPEQQSGMKRAATVPVSPPLHAAPPLYSGGRRATESQLHTTSGPRDSEASIASLTAQELALHQSLIPTTNKLGSRLMQKFLRGRPTPNVPRLLRRNKSEKLPEPPAANKWNE